MAPIRRRLTAKQTSFLNGISTRMADLPELTRHSLRKRALVDAIDDANGDVLLTWQALEGSAALAEFVSEKAPEIRFKDRCAGIRHIRNDVLTRPESREVIAHHIADIEQRVRVHRSFLEAVRQDPELIQA